MNRRKIKPLYEVVPLQTLDGPVISQLDKIIHVAFGHSEDRMNSPYVANFPGDTLVAIMSDRDTPIGVALGEQKTYDIDPSIMSLLQILVHSIAIHTDYQGQGLCKGFVKALLQGIHRHHGKVPIHLNVRVTKDNANAGAIRCYQKNGFRLVSVPPVVKDDGPNAFMVRDSSSTNTHKKKKKRKSRRKSRRKSKR